MFQGWLESQARKVLWSISSSLKWGNIEPRAVVKMKQDETWKAVHIAIDDYYVA